MKILFVSLEENYTMLMHSKIPKRWAYIVEIASYLKNQGNDVTLLDCLNPEISHGEVLKELASVEDYSLLVLTARIETVRSISKMVPIIRQMRPDIKIIVYGDIVNYIPNFFKSLDVDAVVESGDWEVGLSEYIQHLEGLIEEDKVTGVSIKKDEHWTVSKRGKELPNNSWSFPDLTDGFADKDLYLKITGGEITISVSRGCPFNCHFCPAVITFREKDRRKDIQEIIDYIMLNRSEVSEFKFFSPTFTLDEIWVKELCKALIKNDCNIRWSATTRPTNLKDEEMVKLMAESGCYKLAMGVETLDKASIDTLGKYKEEDIYAETKRGFELLKKYNIKAKSLMMMGIQGQNKKNIADSFDTLIEWGSDIRAASFSPRHKLKEMDEYKILDIDEIEVLDKMTYQDIEFDDISREQYLKLIYNTTDYRNILK